MILLLINFYSL